MLVCAGCFCSPTLSCAPAAAVDVLQVYGDIIAASGRGNTIITNLSKGLGATGIVVLLATAAIVVWDVVASAHPVQAAVGDAVQLAAGVGGAYLGDVLATAAAAGLDASPGFIFLAGVAGAIAGAVLIGAFVASLVDEIFSSGKSTLSMAGYQVYVAPLPDGRELASRLVHS